MAQVTSRLFEVGHFAWTGDDDFATYALECGADHNGWAPEEIRRVVKAGA